MVSLSCNLVELPLHKQRALSHCLSQDHLWVKLVDDDKGNVYFMSNDDVARYKSMSDPGEALLRVWGNRGQTVLGFLTRLQALSSHHGAALDSPQLILCRKFKAVKWSHTEEVRVSIISDGRELRLECMAIAFPWPRFSWRKGEVEVGDGENPVLVIPRCSCQADATYYCHISNEVPKGFSFSDFYHKPKKQFSSSITSKPIDISAFVGESLCADCEMTGRQQLRNLVEAMPDVSEETQEMVNEVVTEESLVATDKVALIISNCVYQHLPELVTPLCDAETLAMALQEMKYKTVTLADLTLQEMKFVFKEYKKMLGTGVYAVFYFVGHGFEVNGQCYLLPIDAPLEAHNPQCCLSMDWVLAELSPFSPHLNLILLDVCRKFIPFNCIPSFVDYAEQFKQRNRPNRNTIYGYSTSGGVGAYEVRGEVNGVFMKYLKKHISKDCSVIDMLHMVLKDIEEDAKVCDVQIPELRSTLARPRKLADPMVYRGHTTSFNQHTVHWRLMHELPYPATVNFPELSLAVTIWFDFCGHFTNKVYVFSSVGDMREEGKDEMDEEDRPLSERALSHRAFLKFREELETSKEKVFEDEAEGVSLCVLLSHLQRCKGQLSCRIELVSTAEGASPRPVATANTSLGHVLITRIQMNK